jgi:ectoine hydroxylase-related dioxygenase (phytanoyl-CoA dioxygenase family)
VLTTQGPGEGGFACIPGSHKSNLPTPTDVARLETDLGIVRQPEAKAGSVIIFTEALTHGAMPWKAAHDRRAILYKYAPGGLSYASDYLPRGRRRRNRRIQPGAAGGVGAAIRPRPAHHRIVAG